MPNPTSKMQAVSDELEIRNLIAQLAHLADDGDLNDYVSLFTPDATWETQPVSIPGQAPVNAVPRRGHADILAGARERRASGLQGPGSHSRHILTTTRIGVDGDAATSQSYIMFLRNTDTKAEIAFTGVYRDTYRRTVQGWRLARRVITPG